MKVLRWDGCVRRRHGGRGIPCDTGGWFPIKDILNINLGGLTATLELILNIISSDDKGRFQISGQVDANGFIFD